MPAETDTVAESTILVEVSDTQSHLAVDQAAIIEVVRRTLPLEGFERASISIALVDDAAIERINRLHLGHDWPTDIITFCLSDPGELELTAELVISTEMAKRSALERGLRPIDELILYVIHGLLHLCGEEDATAEESARMRDREAEILDRVWRGRGSLTWTA